MSLYTHASNHHFYSVDSNVYKQSYIRGNKCMLTPPGGIPPGVIPPCYKQDINRMNEKQLHELKTQSNEDEIEGDLYAYEKEHKHLAQRIIRGV